MSHQRLKPEKFLDEERLEALKNIIPEACADNKINWSTLKDALSGELEEEEKPDEHFGLFWPGKREARKLANRPSKGTLIPVKGEGIKEETTRNIFIVGTNIFTRTGTTEIEKLFGKRYFDFPKSSSIIKELISQVLNKKDIILDFFAGSATTAHAILDLNREDGLLTEILLLEGFPLDSIVTQKSEYKENQIRQVKCSFHENQLLVCLDDKLASETIRNLELADGDTFVCLDTAIDDQAKSRLADKGMIKTI